MVEVESFPLISVLVPVFNSPDLLATIKSIICQNYPEIQLIVLDDCSENFDRSGIETLIANKGDNIVEYIIIHNETNIGTVKNLNQGIRKAKGKYIFTIGGDDLFKDGRVLTDWVYEFELTSAEVVTARRESYNEDFTILLDELPISVDVEKITTLKPQELFEELCKYKNFIFGCCTAYKREFLLKIGLFDEKYMYIEDYPTFLNYLRKGGTIKYFDRVVVKHRSGGVSAYHTITNKFVKEENKIVRNEILPYTKNRIQALRSHREWLWNVRKNRIKHTSGMLKKIFYCLVCLIEFPDKIYKHFKVKGGILKCKL